MRLKNREKKSWSGFLRWGSKTIPASATEKKDGTVQSSKSLARVKGGQGKV